MPHAGAAVWPRLQRVVRVLGACRWEYRPGSLRLPADEEEAPSTRQHAAAVDTARVAQGLVGIVVRLPAEELRRSGRESGWQCLFWPWCPYSARLAAESEDRSEPVLHDPDGLRIQLEPL